MDYQLPPGWKRIKNEKGRIEYLTPPPQTRIQSRSQLLEYQRTGKYLELDASKINFLQKNKSHKKQVLYSQKNEPDDIEMTEIPVSNLNPCFPSVYDTNLNTTSVFDTNLNLTSVEDTTQNPIYANLRNSPLDDTNPDQVLTSATNQVKDTSNLPLRDQATTSEAIEVSKLKTIEKELYKVKSAVKLLTINPEGSINHEEDLTKAAKLLSEARAPSKKDDVNLDTLKCKLMDCTSFDSMMKLLWGTEEARAFVQQMQHAVTLEEMFKIGRSYVDGPLKTFPPDVNKNVYFEIIKFAFQNSKTTLVLIVNLVVQKNKAVTNDDVLKVAFYLASFAHTVNRDNNAFLKLKSLLLQKEGLTNEGLDVFTAFGITESSRALRNQKEFFAGISDEVVKAAAQKHPHQVTLDNLDMKIAETPHHMTLEYVEIEQSSTKHLDKNSKSFDEMSQFFNKNTLLLTSPENQVNLKHLEKVTAITVGRILAERVPGAHFLKILLDNHYQHPNSNPKPAILYTKKPQYLHENVNSEMILMCDQMQQDFLNLSAELTSDKTSFLNDIELMKKVDIDDRVREAAEMRVHSSVLETGEFIGHGDLLTFEQFYNAKRLRQSCVTALERLEYLRYFRVALFHEKMNKVFQDYGECMRNENNIDDLLTLAWFKSWHGLGSITNNASKIKKPGNFEYHDQYVTEVGVQYLANAFTNHLEMKGDHINVNNTAEAQEMILEFLKENQIKFYFDPKGSLQNI